MDNQFEKSCIEFFVAEIQRTKKQKYPTFFVYNKSDLWETRADKEDLVFANRIIKEYDIPFIDTVVKEPGKGRNVETLLYYLVKSMR